MSLELHSMCEMAACHKHVGLYPSVKKYFSNMLAHQRLIDDKSRLEAFETAIMEVVRPGSIVLDLGAGTGVLAEMALRAGADVVYLIEENSNILEAARERLKKWSEKRRVEFFRASSEDIPDGALQPAPDVVISETVGSLAFDEGFVLNMADAERLAIDNASFVPSRLELVCAPVSYDFRLVDACCRLRPQSACQTMRLRPFTSLCQWDAGKRFCNQSEVTVDIPHDAAGLAFWGEMRLSHETTFSTFPRDAQNSWGLVVWQDLPACSKLQLYFRIVDITNNDSVWKEPSVHTQCGQLKIIQPINDKRTIVIEAMGIS